MSTSLQLFNTKVSIENYNHDFLILKPEVRAQTGAIGKAIFQKQFDFISEVIVTEVEICLKLKPGFDPAKIVLLNTIGKGEISNSKQYKLPVFFNDHEDWNTIKSVAGFNKAEVISKLTNTDFSIAMFGFLPGFIYLDGLDASLHVPRKTVPAKYVEASSIAIGGKYVGLYALDSPGGWHVIGRIPISILQIPNLPPLALNLKDRIILQPINQETYKTLLSQQISLKEYNA